MIFCRRLLLAAHVRQSISASGREVDRTTTVAEKIDSRRIEVTCVCKAWNPKRSGTHEGQTNEAHEFKWLILKPLFIWRSGCDSSQSRHTGRPSRSALLFPTRAECLLAPVDVGATKSCERSCQWTPEIEPELGPLSIVNGMKLPRREMDDGR